MTATLTFPATSVTITRLPEPLVITVEDAEGLDALPVGIEITDADGFLLNRTEEGYGFPELPVWDEEGRAEYRDTFDFTHFLPGVIQNPELLGKFKAPLTKSDFPVGTRVEILDPFWGEALVGEQGVVNEWSNSADLVRVTIDSHHCNYLAYKPNEIRPLPAVEPEVAVPSVPGGFTVGDRIVVTASNIYGIPQGTLGTVIESPQTYVRVLTDTGRFAASYYPFYPHEIAPYAEPSFTLADEIGAYVGDAAALDSLPNGTVITQAQGNRLRVKLAGYWTDERDVRMDFSTALIARNHGFVIAYLPPSA